MFTLLCINLNVANSVLYICGIDFMMCKGKLIERY